MLQGHTFTSACQSYIYCIYPWIPRSMINKYINNDPPPRRTACCTLHVEWSRYVWIQRNHQLQAPASVQTRSQSGYSLEVTTKFRGSFHIIFHVEWAACLHSWSSSIYFCQEKCWQGKNFSWTSAPSPNISKTTAKYRCPLFYSWCWPRLLGIITLDPGTLA